jgi:hypothetical protein
VASGVGLLGGRHDAVAAVAMLPTLRWKNLRGDRTECDQVLRGDVASGPTPGTGVQGSQYWVRSSARSMTATRVMRSGCASMPKLEPVTNLLGRRSRKGDCLPKGVDGPESDAIFSDGCHRPASWRTVFLDPRVP